MKYLGKLLLRSFLQGLLIIGPIGTTIFVIYYIFFKIDSLIPQLSSQYPGLAFLLVLTITTLIGFLGTKLFIGRWIVNLFDQIMEKTPGIKLIYSSIKDVLNSFVGEEKKFNHPVWVRVSDTPEMWRIGFLTQENWTLNAENNDMIAVYLPHSYAISGWVIVTKSINILPVENMTSAEAMKFAVSGGISTKTEKQ